MTLSGNNIDLEALWTKQLYREYEEIVWYHRLPLKSAVIQITDLGKRWGLWDPFFRTISLHRDLIHQHSWDVVLEILKHEMAHQYVAEVLGQSDDTIHGPSFTKACARIGVAGWAAKASGEIPEKIATLRERVLSDEDERLILKAEKLLALAQSTNEHEALLAMQKVRELYAKHNLDRLRANREGQMDSLYICRRRKKVEAHESMIYRILNEHFFVKVIYTGLYDAVAATKYKAVELLGARENLLMAEYVFLFLFQQCESLWLSHKKQTRCDGRLRRSYQLGILYGFSEKLKLQSVQTKAAQDLGISDTQSKALTVLARNELDAFVGLKYPRLASRSQGRSRVDGGTFEAGKSAGKTITLNRGVTAKNSGFGGFLGK